MQQAVPGGSGHTFDGVVASDSGWKRSFSWKRQFSESIVGVDVEAEDGGDFDGLGAAHGGLKFPGAQGGDDFRGHVGRASIENADIFHVARGIEGAFQRQAGVSKTFGQIDANRRRRGESSAKGVRAGGFIGELHA